MPAATIQTPELKLLHLYADDRIERALTRAAHRSRSAQLRLRLYPESGSDGDTVAARYVTYCLVMETLWRRLRDDLMPDLHVFDIAPGEDGAPSRIERMCPSGSGRPVTDGRDFNEDTRVASLLRIYDACTEGELAGSLDRRQDLMTRGSLPGTDDDFSVKMTVMLAADLGIQ